ncbi:FMRFamide receptor-like [Elysia marginata]|uniref:FMRFamide receptor-like n=1 Tax=Elysia marginata TaxID=1093978 RepID=A0AAV4EXL5_9GAST|nr:FMRFamide receptor-like [Elysia marginata]
MESFGTPASHIMSTLLSGKGKGDAVSSRSGGFYEDGSAVGTAAVKLLLNSSVNLLTSAGIGSGEEGYASGREYGISKTRGAGGIQGVGFAGTVGEPSHVQPAEDFFSLNRSVDYINSFQDQLLSHSTFRMRDELVKYANPMLIVLGNISNLLALIVLRRKKFKRSSVAFYLAAYAVANLLVLNLMLGLSWALYIFELKHVTYIADWTCRLWMFLSNVITYTGIWIVVAMNVDRLIYLTPRSNTQAHCTRFSAKVVVVVIVVLLIVVSIHAMWTYELRRHGCFVAFERNDLHTIIWPWWSAAVYSYIPLFSLIALNVVQAVVLCLHYFRQGDGTAWGVVVSRYDSEGMDNFVLTAMTISLHFFFLTVPATVINVLDIHLPSSWLQVDVIARIELAKKITEQMSSLNHSLLGLHLLLCSPDFRREFAQCFRSVFRCRSSSKRPFKSFELHGGGGCGAGGGGPTSNSDDSTSPHREVDYELCNSNEYRDGDMTITSV